MTEWIAVDWGSSRLRAWVMGTDGQVMSTCASDDGMSALDPEDFEPALLTLLADHLPEGRQTLVVCCGMVGARQGWVEADYTPVPCYPVIQQNSVRAPTRDPRLDVHILSGVKQTNPADVMRGEETQVAGFVKSHPDFAGIICLPGTHTKWVSVSAQKIVAFSTCMTGELYALLSRQSLLRHSMNGEGWDEAAFIESVRETWSDPALIARRLFSLRSEALLGELHGATAQARLSGMLIGLELASLKSEWQKQKLIVIGATQQTDQYRRGLKSVGATVSHVDGDLMTRAGLTAAYELLKENDQ